MDSYDVLKTHSHQMSETAAKRSTSTPSQVGKMQQIDPENVISKYLCFILEK